jgi:hypothetical protein
MTASIGPTQADLQTVLRAFLVGILPDGVEIFEGQDNRVPEPSGNDFVVMTPFRFDRLETNVDSFADVKFVGSITGNTLTVESISLGQIKVGTPVFGVGVADGTIVKALGSGNGGAGTYILNNIQAVASENLAGGGKTMVQATMVTVQLDVHGPNASDNVQIISTSFRDSYAVEKFTAINPAVTPLYADNPRQLPFVNAEQQYEYRWSVDAAIQNNQTVTQIPQQFADTLDLDVISVEEAYPA